MQEELLNGSSQFETQSLSYTVLEEVFLNTVFDLSHYNIIIS